MMAPQIGLAFSTISCPDFTFAQMADAVRRYGYDGIELYALEGQKLTADILRTRLSEAKSALAGIPIVSINSWGTLSDPDPAERARQEAQIALAFDLAAELHCPLVKTFGGEIPTDRPRSDVFDTMAESLWRLAEAAQAHDVTLVMETHDGFCLGADLAQLLRRVPHPHFAALWDVHHPYRKGESAAETDRLIGDRVAHVHVKDAVAIPGGWRFVPLGDGELPVSRMLSHLLGRNYRGYVAVDWEKMWHPELDDPDQSLPQHIDVLRAYLRDHAGTTPAPACEGGAAPHQ